MAGKCTTMLIMGFISLSVMTFAFTVNDWTIIEWDDDDDSVIIGFGLRHMEYSLEQNDGDSITQGTDYSEMEEVHDACTSEDDLDENAEMQCNPIEEFLQTNEYSTYGTYASIGLGIIGLILGAFASIGLSPKYSAVLILIAGLAMVATGGYYHQTFPSSIFDTIYGNQEMTESFGIALWLTFVAGGLSIIGSLIGFFSEAHHYY